VESTSQDDIAGLMVNDVIEAVNGQRVVTIDDFVKVMNKTSLVNGISLDVYRQGRRVNLILKS
ncbi:MAG: hypothetical protein HQ580_14750, partial [Planctomycetes bacterium]|nr:hypothetical protein [Planctomycetota bacterium]